MLAAVTYKLTDLWIKGFTKIKVLGPIAYGTDEYQRMIAFRAIQNQQRAPYLEDKHQIDIETSLKIDERSLHFALEKDSQIVACVRLTPLPFEFSALSNEFALRSLEFHNYFEFGRLCTDMNLERKGFHAGILVVKAAQHIFSKNKAKGVVGICKTDRAPYMAKLGLRIDPMTVRLKERQSDYHLLHASKEELLAYYFNRFFGLFSKKAPKATQTVQSPGLRIKPQPNPLEKTHESRPSEKPSRSGIWQAS